MLGRNSMEKEEKIMISRLAVSALLFVLSFFAFWGNLGKLIVSILANLVTMQKLKILRLVGQSALLTTISLIMERKKNF